MRCDVFLFWDAMIFCNKFELCDFQPPVSTRFGRRIVERRMLPKRRFWKDEPKMKGVITRFGLLTIKLAFKVLFNCANARSGRIIILSKNRGVNEHNLGKAPVECQHPSTWLACNNRKTARLPNDIGGRAHPAACGGRSSVVGACQRTDQRPGDGTIYRK